MPKFDNSQNPFYNEQADLRYPTPRTEVESGSSDEIEVSPSVGKTDAESSVRLNEDASLQDKEYSFDEDNTGSEEYHDADSAEDAGDHAFDI